MGKILGKAMLCALAGGLVWLIIEPLFPGSVTDLSWGRVEAWFIGCLMFAIGATAGFWHGWQRGGKSNIWMGVLMGGVFGTIGGMLGSQIGGGLVYAFFGGPEVFLSTGWSPVTVMARFVAFFPIGLFLGAGAGISLRSFRGVMAGAVGGLIGAGISGLTFDLIGIMMSPFIPVDPSGTTEVGMAGRAFLAFSMGFFIGLFTAIFEMATRQAWVRLVLGRNEGKEWPIDSVQTTIGRDERAHIPLFADPRLPQLAAVIQKQGHQYVLVDPSSPIGVGLNGQRVSQAFLSPGDNIQVGELQLQFLMRSGAARRAQEGRAKGVPMTPYQGGGQPQQPIQPIQPIQPQQPVSSPTQMSNPTVAAPSQAPVATGFSLVVISGPSAGDRFPVTGPMEIGREGSGIRLSWDAQASRRHASVCRAGDGLEVTDLASTNGTLVNGTAIKTSVLRPGDTLQIGSTQFRVEAGG